MSDLFLQAAEMMLAGMGVVFVFLILLTGAVTLLTKLCPEASIDSGASSAPSAGNANEDADAKKLAAIAVAVKRYRASKSDNPASDA